MDRSHRLAESKSWDLFPHWLVFYLGFLSLWTPTLDLISRTAHLELVSYLFCLFFFLRNKNPFFSLHDSPWAIFFFPPPLRPFPPVFRGNFFTAFLGTRSGLRFPSSESAARRGRQEREMFFLLSSTRSFLEPRFATFLHERRPRRCPSPQGTHRHPPPLSLLLSWSSCSLPLLHNPLCVSLSPAIALDQFFATTPRPPPLMNHFPFPLRNGASLISI